MFDMVTELIQQSLGAFEDFKNDSRCWLLMFFEYLRIAGQINILQKETAIKD